MANVNVDIRVNVDTDPTDDNGVSTLIAAVDALIADDGDVLTWHVDQLVSSLDGWPTVIVVVAVDGSYDAICRLVRRYLDGSGENVDEWITRYVSR